MEPDDIDAALGPDEPPDPEPDDRRSGRAIAVAAGIAAVVGLGVAAYWLLGRDGGDGEAAPEAVTAAPAPEPVAPPEPDPVALPEPDPAPPALDDSDSFIGAAVGGLSSHPGLAAWLAGERVLRRFVVAVDNVANGRNPAQHLPLLRPGERFSTSDESPQARVAPASYRRYDLHAEIIDSLDTAAIGMLYGVLAPLLDAAYSELGYPDTPFSSALGRAIDHLLAAPVVEDPPVVTRGMVFHEYASERLAALSPAQKQFIGMGPDNVRTVQAKLRAIADALALASDR